MGGGERTIPLDDARKAALRDRLHADEARLTAQIALLDERAREAQTPDEVAFSTQETLQDEAGLAVEREKEQAVMRGLQGVLRDVRAALAKLDRDAYGRCDTCGQPIDPRRLNAVPHATLCLSCQAKAERARVAR